MAVRYYHCPRCNLVIHQSEVYRIDGKWVHPVKVHGYDTDIIHEVIEEP